MRNLLLTLSIFAAFSDRTQTRWISFAQTGAGAGAQMEKDVRQLDPGKPIERELAGGQSHSYRITLAAGQYLDAVVEQRVIDVVVALLGPDGKRLIEVDSPNGEQGPEPVSWIVETAGDYRLVVRSLEKNAAAGRYEVKVIELRAATERDRALAEARKLFNEAVSLQAKRKYDEAIPLAERSLVIKEKTLGSESPDVAASLDILASLYQDKSDSARAEPLFRRSLAILENTLGTEHPDIATLLGKLATLHHKKGEYAKAEPLYQRALAIREKTLKPDDPAIALSLNNLAVLYNDLADYASAEPLQRRALAIDEKALGPEHQDVATRLNNLAFLHYNKGEYDKAEPLYRRAMAIQEKAFGTEHQDVALSLNNLALLYKDKGDYVNAEQLYKRALAIWEKVLRPEHPMTALALNNLALVYYNKGEYDKAEPLFRRALAIRENALGPENTNVASTLNNLALLSDTRGDHDKAEPLYRRALAIWEKAYGTEHPRVALTLNNLARLNYNKGDYAGAEPLYQRALAIWEKAVGPTHPNVATTLSNLGALHLVRGETAQAIETRRRAAEISEINLDRNVAIGSERQKLAYLATLSGQSHAIISLHVRSAPDDPAARDLAVTTILRRKGRALDAMTDSVAALRRRATPEDRALLDQLKETRSQLARLALNRPQRITAAEHQARTKSLEERIEKIEAEISGRSAEFRALSRPVTIAAVQSAIPAGSALVEFFAYRPFNPKVRLSEALGAPRYVAYVLRPAGETRWVDLGETKAIDEAVDKLRRALRDPRRRDVKQLAREVDRLTMDQLRPLLRPSRQVFLSPDGALNLVPFAALVDRGGHYLVSHYEFSYLTSGRDLLRLRASRPARRGAMVLANPDFGDSVSEGAEGDRGIKLKYQPASDGESSILSGAFFPPLSGTADEAKALKAMLADATVLTGAQATEAALKQAASPRILHIATHGFFLPDVATSDESRGLLLSDDNFPTRRVENPLLRSGLALTGANLRKTGAGHEDDGVLTAAEASSLDLWGTKLVVLSACDTGVGEVRNGDGVYGLRRALTLAGAETQVMSLWPVSDKATRNLMIEYYKKLLSGRGRSEALREAQLRMLAGGARASDGSSRTLITKSGDDARQTPTIRAKDYSHPYYWACFILSGEWKKLDMRETAAR